jgi:periplasmic divalent cation tolerance protein
MFIAWTTVPDKAIADTLATSAVDAGLAVCVQIEGPITSHYIWACTREKTEEYRLTFKLLPAQLAALETWIHVRHPYQVPQWIVVKAEHVGEKYLSWARGVRNK